MKELDHQDTLRANTPALVWGACGFIGRHLVRSLLASGAKVSVLTRPKINYPEPDWASEVTWYELDEADECNEKVYREAVAGNRRIFNLAGASGAAASNRDPLAHLRSLRGQIQMLEACAQAQHQPHVVFTSSRLVYGRTGDKPVDEEHAVAPRSIYAVHKISVENYHRVFARLGVLSYTICRIANAYGFDGGSPASGYRIINNFITDSMAGRPIVLFGDGSQLRDFVHVDDIVRLLNLVSIEPAARNEVFNIGSGERLTMHAAATAIYQRTGGPGIRYVPWPAEHAIVESGDYVANIEKARQAVRFTPKHSFLAGLEATIEANVRTATRSTVDA